MRRQYMLSCSLFTCVSVRLSHHDHWICQGLVPLFRCAHLVDSSLSALWQSQDIPVCSCVGYVMCHGLPDGAKYLYCFDDVRPTVPALPQDWVHLHLDYLMISALTHRFLMPQHDDSRCSSSFGGRGEWRRSSRTLLSRPSSTA